MKLNKLLSFGNTKLPKNIAIFNMCSATECPSKLRGLCSIADKCYAMKAERQYPACKPYRDRQNFYFKNNTADDFVIDFKNTINGKKDKVKFLRISEAGDFETQDDVNKIIEISNKLKNEEINTYVYTSRIDLDFSDRGSLVVNGSGTKFKEHLKSNNIDNLFVAVKDIPSSLQKNERVCLGDCSICKLCAVKGNKIIFVKEH